MTVKVTVRRCGGNEFRLASGRSADTLNPKEMLLYATACCAGMTVNGILDKQHLTVDSFEITMSGELDTDTVMAQSTYGSFRISYHLSCPDTNAEKVREAVKRADEKYCGTLKMIRRIAPVTSQIEIGEAVAAL